MTARSATVLIIGGPTASGKSGLAAAVAATIDGAVVNADSMQMYRGLPILTAQPTAAERAQAPHNLYEHFAPTETCDAVLWRQLVLAEIESLHAAGHLPVLTGGTGFYIKTLLDGISPMPEIDPAFRTEAMVLHAEMGNPAFHASLAARDPETAAKLDPMNTQRVARAWEVLLATGKGLSEWQNAPREKPPAHLRFVTVTLLPPRESLYERCDRRFDAMMQQGAVAEAKAFQDAYPGPSPLKKALGYPEICRLLAGEITAAEAKELAQASTRQYAKRQTTWFRHQIRADLVLEDPDPAPVLALLGR